MKIAVVLLVASILLAIEGAPASARGKRCHPDMPGCIQIVATRGPFDCHPDKPGCVIPVVTSTPGCHPDMPGCIVPEVTRKPNSCHPDMPGCINGVLAVG